MVCVSSVGLNASSKTIETGRSFTLSATVCPSNATNKSLVWSSSNSSVATVSGGVVCAKSKGTATIKAAAQDGSGKSASCCVTVTEGVLATSVTVSPSSKTLKVDDTTRLIATVCPANVSNSSVSWRSGTPSVVSVNASSGVINALKAGTATIYATAADGSGKQGHSTVTVTDVIKVSSITLNVSSKSIQKGNSYTLSATVCPTNANDKTLTWSSSNSSVATVSGGKVCAIAKGTATIKATANDGSGKSASCSITVTGDTLVTSVAVCPASKTLNVGKSTYLSACVYPANATNSKVSWCSGNPSVASVNASSALVNALKVGTATIYAQAQDGSGKTGTCKITVTDPGSSSGSGSGSAPDNREKVNVKKDGEYLIISFASGRKWKSIKYDLGALDPKEAPPYEKQAELQERANENAHQDFTVQQLAFLYLFDPLGVEHYVKNYTLLHNMDLVKYLEFKDNIYEAIFGVPPRFYRQLPTGKIVFYSNAEGIRTTVHSDAEMIFGQHVIADALSIGNYVAQCLVKLFLSIPQVAAAWSAINICRAMFFSSSVTETFLGEASDFFKEYFNTVGLPELFKTFNWASKLLNEVKDAAEAFTPPDYQDIKIYRKISEENFKTYFTFSYSGKSFDLSIEELIERCKA